MCVCVGKHRPDRRHTGSNRLGRHTTTTLTTSWPPTDHMGQPHNYAIYSLHVLYALCFSAERACMQKHVQTLTALLVLLARDSVLHLPHVLDALVLGGTDL